jgi:hypothetical protein
MMSINEVSVCAKVAANSSRQWLLCIMSFASKEHEVSMHFDES